MLTNIFESRNKTFTNLIKLGDYLGRSLRENVELFAVENNSVTYLTESGYIIKGDYDKTALKLNNLEIQNSEILENKKVYSKLVDTKISNFLADLLENDLSTAQNNFDSILNLWENKLKFENTKKRLDAKVEKFNESLNIINTPEFQRLFECKDDLINFLKESVNISNIPEIKNTVKLSSIISKSFDTPRLPIEKLAESATFAVPVTINHTIYDHLCKQELIAKELVESKKSLDTIWIINEKVQKLPSYIYESDQNIMELVADIITQIPYFAMATKKQLTNLVEGNLDLITESSVPAKDIKKFVAKIYEFKKPVRDHFVSLLNEKYGVDVNSLTTPANFDSLAKTQAFIFESLSNLCDENSNLSRVLLEFSEMMSSKSGVETIDISDFLNYVFVKSNYSKQINETSLLNYLNFEKVADDLGKIGEVLKMIQSGVAGGAMGGQMPMGQGSPMQAMAGEGEYEPDGGDMAGMGEEGEEEEDMPNEEDTPMAQMDPEEAAAQAQEEPMDGEEQPMEGEEETPEVPQGELIDNLKELEELISVLKGDMGLGGDEEGGEEMPDEESEDDMGIDTGEGDDEVHIDVDSHNDDDEEDEEGEEEYDDEEEGGEEEDEEEEDMPPKKKFSK